MSKFTTLYSFYLKKDHDLYAFTIVKEYANLFKIQRNMDLFEFRKIKDMEENKFRELLNKNHTLQLGKDHLFDGLNEIEIIATEKESYELSTACEYIIDSFPEIKKEIRDAPFKSKYKKSINKLIDGLNCDTNDELNLDTLAIFYRIASETFTPHNPDEKYSNFCNIFKS